MEEESDPDRRRCRLVSRCWDLAYVRRVYKELAVCPHEASFQRVKAITTKEEYRCLVKELCVDVSVMPEIRNLFEWKAETEWLSLRHTDFVHFDKDDEVSPCSVFFGDPTMESLYLKWSSDFDAQSKFIRMSLEDLVKQFHEIKIRLPNVRKVSIHENPISSIRGVPSSDQDLESMIFPCSVCCIPEDRQVEVRSGRNLRDFVHDMIRACMETFVCPNAGQLQELHCEMIPDTFAALGRPEIPDRNVPSTDNPKAITNMNLGLSWHQLEYETVQVSEKMAAVFGSNFLSLQSLTIGSLQHGFFHAIYYTQITFPRLHDLHLYEAHLIIEDFNTILQGNFPRLKKLTISDSKLVQDKDAPHTCSWPEVWSLISSSQSRKALATSWHGILRDDVGGWTIWEEHLKSHDTTCGCLLRRLEVFANGEGICPLTLPESFADSTPEFWGEFEAEARILLDSWREASDHSLMFDEWYGKYNYDIYWRSYPSSHYNAASDDGDSYAWSDDGNDDDNELIYPWSDDEYVCRGNNDESRYKTSDELTKWKSI
ncbi:MAG: hypothetical protein Q9227_004117 [Pyrenula ochraceoflavens]